MLLNRQKLKIMDAHLSNINIKTTASEIARKQKLNQKTVYLYLEKLRKEGVLESEEQGKNKLYQINKANKELVKQYFCSLEHLKTTYFYIDNPKIKQMLQKILPKIRGITVIFGSYAKKTQKDISDLDILIIGNYDEQIEEITETYTIEVNIQNQKKYEENTLTEEVRKNHIIVKNTEKIIEQWINSNGAKRKV